MTEKELLQTPEFNSMPIRQTFIEAGLILLKTGGVDNLTLSNLLKQSGHARGSFYASFTSKSAYEAEVYWYYFQPQILMIEQLAIDDQLSGHEKLSLWSARTLKWMDECLNRGERILTLTEVAARYPEATPPSFLFKTLFGQRTRNFEKILSQSSTSDHPNSAEEAGLLLVMLDGVITRAFQCQSLTLAKQFFSYNFPCQLITHGIYD